MQEEYDPKKIEKRVQTYWEENKTFEVNEDSSKEKFYCLSMFPYPSGRLHMGHVRNYTISDVISRFQRLRGKNVMQPIGWDAFGLPAENAAVANGVPPAHWTYSNIDSMKSQLKLLGFGYDWSRELVTCDPDYYRWEQKFFTKLHKKGLVFKKKSWVNWCPTDKTVLANEQVEKGHCWRCETAVEQREVSQWFIRITEYAQELLDGLDKLDGWPEVVKTMQRNWIGRSEGINVKFPVKNYCSEVAVYTTRPDTLMGVTCICISVDHPVSRLSARNNSETSAFIKKYRSTKVTEITLSTMEKRGIDTGLRAVHPLSDSDLPIYVANFVSNDYPTGAIMVVPAHNQRDFDFANQYNLQIIPVIQQGPHHGAGKAAYTGKGTLLNSGEFNGLTSQVASKAITDKLESEGKGERAVTFRLRDWSVSRQRYWGAPIPMVTTEDGQDYPVPEERLPVVLPENMRIDGIASPIKLDKDWAKDTLNGVPVLRDTDTFDTFIQSSWYHARYCSPNANDILDSEKADYWLPVDQYVGGIEHACMHLLYARFFHKLLRDTGYVSSDEPFNRLLCQGMVTSDAFFYLDSQGKKKWVSPKEVTVERDGKGRIISAIDTGIRYRDL